MVVNAYPSGCAVYSDFAQAYRLTEISHFLNGLEPDQKSKHRDTIILTLLYQTTRTTGEMHSILKGYLTDLR